MHLDCRVLGAVLLLASSALADEALGTLTVKGRTTILRHAYVTREPDAANASREYIVFLLTDAKLAPGDREPSRLQALAREGRLRALKVRWAYGFDDVSCVPYHADIVDSGQTHRGQMILDLRALDDRRVKAQVRSKMLGQDWHFNARLEAAIRAGQAVELEAPADAVIPDSKDAEAASRTAGADDPATRVKRDLGRMGFEYTPQGMDQAVRAGNAEAVRLFLKLGMSANGHDLRGEHVMMTAVTLCDAPPEDGRADVVLALLAGGSDVNGGRKGRSSMTLIWAVQHCPVKVVQAMIEAGAEVNARVPGGGATPLMMAGFRQDGDGEEVIEMLRKAGAKE